MVIAGLPFPADHARFRAVCRSWRCIPCPRTLPMAALRLGLLHLPSHGGFHEIHRFSANDRCIGSTDGWLALDTTDAHTNRHTYTLFNPFTKARVSLPELDAVIGGNVSKPFAIHKVLLQSGLDGLIAVRTNNRNHPIILLKPGKDVWLPPPRSRPFTRIIDVAFLQDNRLYGITRDEDLISFSIDFDSQGIPVVTSINGVIKNQSVSVKKDVMRERTGDYIVNDGMHFAHDYEKPVDVGHIVTIWYLVESCEKLLMVRRQLQQLPCRHGVTRKVEVFKADAVARTWVPVTDGLHGHALFLSGRFSKSVFARDEVEADAIYFIDTREVFNMRSKTTSPPNLALDFSATWLFHPSCF
ncbi:unnamed protein product [Alopecurus aequalis]